MPRKQNKVSKGAKKFWNAISTGWVVEYPGQGGPPRDFFDRRDRMPQGVREKWVEPGSERGSDNGEDTADAIFRWKAELKATKKE
jgi:hypothetical protein